MYSYSITMIAVVFPSVLISPLQFSRNLSYNTNYPVADFPIVCFCEIGDTNYFFSAVRLYVKLIKFFVELVTAPYCLLFPQKYYESYVSLLELGTYLNCYFCTMLYPSFKLFSSTAIFQRLVAELALSDKTGFFIHLFSVFCFFFTICVYFDVLN